jgi:uncharacterized protein YjbI with pentapeptide repeats
MATKAKERAAKERGAKERPTAKDRAKPRFEASELRADFARQLQAGAVEDAELADAALPSLQPPPGQSLRINRCWLRSVTLSGPKARGLQMRDARIESSDLANIDLTGATLDRVEIVSTRLTGAAFAEARLKSVLFQECKLDYSVWRMAQLEQCAFERCNLVEADFYDADLSGAIVRGCDLSGADVSHVRLTAADFRDCRLDGMRGTPESMEGLVISPDQAALLITLYGVKVEW